MPEDFQAMKYRSIVTKNERIEVERRSGIRYSCLLELLYFNSPRMCIVDPMHNLLLCTPKMMVELSLQWSFVPFFHSVTLQNYGKVFA